MKVGKRLKAIMAFLMTMVVVLGAMPLAAKAASTFEGLGNTTTGTINITKYVSDTTEKWESFDAVQDLSKLDGLETLDGVTFTILKVGTIKQTVSDAGQVDVVYTISDALESALGLSGSPNDYSSTVLDEKLKTLTQSAAEELVKDSTSYGITVDGEVKFEGLEFGLYLVVETNSPSTVTSKSVPFLVSIPSVVNGADGNTTWTTTVNAYPKNAVGTANVDKLIDTGYTADNGYTSTTAYYTNAAINDTVAYQIPFTVPVPDGGLKQLGIKDTLTAGLTYTTNSLLVYKVENGTETLVDSANYEVTTVTAADTNETTIKVTFKEDYLSTLSGDSVSFCMKYTCTLNANAVLGQTGNKNSVALYYSNNPASDKDVFEETPTESEHAPVVYTYGIRITKVKEDGTTGLNGVEFKLTNEDGTVTYFTGTTAADGDGNVGILEFRGLEPGTYKITETKTEAGYILLKDPITIEITGAADGSATAEVGGQAVNMTADGGSNYALVPLTIVNEKGFSLPATGGTGTAIFAFVGILLVVVAGLLLVIRKKNK